MNSDKAVSFESPEPVETQQLRKRLPSSLSVIGSVDGAQVESTSTIEGYRVMLARLFDAEGTIRELTNSQQDVATDAPRPTSEGDRGETDQHARDLPSGQFRHGTAR